MLVNGNLITWLDFLRSLALVNATPITCFGLYLSLVLVNVKLIICLRPLSLSLLLALACLGP